MGTLETVEGHQSGGRSTSQVGCLSKSLLVTTLGLTFQKKKRRKTITRSQPGRESYLAAANIDFLGNNSQQYGGVQMETVILKVLSCFLLK